MRAPLAKAVRIAFEQKLKEELPQFNPVVDLEVPDECRVYEWRVTQGLRLYLMLQVHRQEDSFSIEIGWSLDGRWPEDATLPVAPPEVSECREARFRIGLLWSRNPDYWWDLAPRLAATPLEKALEDYDAFLERFKKRPDISEALARIGPAMEDAFTRLRQYALPYFRKIAAATPTS
jgi:hypothetical protein